MITTKEEKDNNRKGEKFMMMKAWGAFDDRPCKSDPIIKFLLY